VKTFFEISAFWDILGIFGLFLGILGHFRQLSHFQQFDQFLPENQVFYNFFVLILFKSV